MDSKMMDELEKAAMAASEGPWDAVKIRGAWRSVQTSRRSSVS